MKKMVWGLCTLFAFVLCFSFSVAVATPIQDGTTIQDLSGNNNNGTVYGCSLEDDGLRFNGSLDSYILVDDSPSLDLGSSYESGSNDSLMYRIAFAADILIGQPNTIGDQTLPMFVEIANEELKPNIVLTLGDCFEPELRYADQFLDIMEKLQCPWVYVWGNHEHAYDGQTPIAEQMKQLLLARGVDAEERRYTYLDVDDDGGADYILVIFSTFISKDDLLWFESTFKDSETPIIVLQHIPSVTPHVSMRLPNAEEEMGYFRENGNVFAVFSCHDHGYTNAVQDNGTWYINVRRVGSRWGVEPGYGIMDFYSNGSVEFYTKCFNLSGTFNHATLEDAEDTGYTVEIECTPYELPAYSYLLDKGGAGNRNYGMCIMENGIIYTVSHNTFGELWAGSEKGLVSNGTPLHAIAVANSAFLRLFLNGEKVAECPACPPYTANDNPIYIGRTYRHPFNGTMRSVRLYDVPLTEEQVASHFSGSYGVEEEDLVLHYDMNASTLNNVSSSSSLSINSKQNEKLATTYTVCNGNPTAKASEGSYPLLVREHITSLPYEISSPGYYVLETDGTNTSWEHAIKISCSDVVLDGNGHMLDGGQKHENMYGSPLYTKRYGVLSENVSNITIEDIRLTNWTHGIYWENCTHSHISNNTYQYNDFGIFLESCHENQIKRNNLLSNKYDGIALSHSHNNSLENNTATNNGFGIFLHHSHTNVLTHNTFHSNEHDGAYLCYSSDNRLSQNIATNNNYGVCISISPDNIVENNTFVHDGLCLWNSSQNTILNNLVNNKKLIYLEGVSNQVISDTDVGQVVLVKCQNITVKNLNISNTSCGVDLWRTTHSTIENSTVSKCGAGIYLHYSSTYNKIMDNILSDNVYGIHLDGYTKNNSILENVVSNNSQGITVYGRSDGNVIERNVVVSNSDVGVYISHAYTNVLVNNSLSNNYRGVSLFRTDGNQIKENSVMGSERSGILLHSSNENHISDNAVSDSRVGIQLNHSRNNTINHNTL